MVLGYFSTSSTFEDSGSSEIRTIITFLEARSRHAMWMGISPLPSLSKRESGYAATNVLMTLEGALFSQAYMYHKNVF